MDLSVLILISTQISPSYSLSSSKGEEIKSGKNQVLRLYPDTALYVVLVKSSDLIKYKSSLILISIAKIYTGARAPIKKL
jgi:hypothetical protein